MSATNPDYYRTRGIECIDIAETMNFNMGSALKYIWRAGMKDDVVQDLAKAVWYLNREVERLGVEAPNLEKLANQPRRFETSENMDQTDTPAEPGQATPVIDKNGDIWRRWGIATYPWKNTRTDLMIAWEGLNNEFGPLTIGQSNA